MRKIIFILTLLTLAVCANAQYPINSRPGAPKTQTSYRGGLGVDSSFVIIYAFTDTTAANRGFLKNIPGCIIRTTGNVLWMRNNAITAWINLSAAIAGNNVYIRISKLYDSLGNAPNDSLLILKSIEMLFKGVRITSTGTDTTAVFNIVPTNDTTTIASGQVGAGAAGDTASFATTYILGSFFNALSDSLVITNLRIGLQGTSPSVAVTVYWNDSLGTTAGAVKLVNAGSTATNTTTGTSVTSGSFNNNTIPPNVWVWFQTTTVTTKPTMMTVSLVGYKKSTVY